MRKKIKFGIAFGIALVALFFGAGTCYASISKNYVSKTDYDNEHKIIFTANEQNYTKTFKELGIETDEKYVKKTDPILNVNKEKLLENIIEINTGRSDRIFPEIFIGNNSIEITNYDEGNLIDVDTLCNYIINHSEEYVLNINLDDFLLEYNDKSPAEMYDELAKKAEIYNNFSIEYTNNEKITTNDLLDYIYIEDNEILNNFDSNEFKNYLTDIVLEKTNSYNTYYNEWDFTTTDGDNIKIKTDKNVDGEGVYGSIVDNEQELEYIYDLILNLKNESQRIPMLKKDNGFEIPDDYVEVNIEKQHVWIYKDGNLIMDSGCVTGNKGTMDTPRGVYYVFQKLHNVTFETGGKSKNWMKFTYRGHGLHDATWRSVRQFDNPKVYQGNGSHGCVNLPLSFSNDLYDTIDIGTVVVIY